MTERKKPGPKPKCKECGRKEGEGHYDDCPVGLGVIEKARDALHADRVMDAIRAEHPEAMIAKKAQDYAIRVWSGQSVSLPRAERLRRVAKALEGQGLSMEGVEL